MERDNPAIARWVAEDWPRIQKKPRDERAHVVLIDESGFFLNPTVRRTWAPKGRTPVLTGFGRHRDKVSTIAAIIVAPRRRRVGLYWRTDPEHYIDAAARRRVPAGPAAAPAGQGDRGLGRRQQPQGAG